MTLSSPRHAVLGVSLVAALSSSSFAAMILPGGSASLVAGLPVAGSTTTLATNTSPFTGLSSTSVVVFSGTETSTVIKGDTNNPLGGLTFVYTVTNSTNSLDSIDRISLSSFLGFSTQVEYAGSGDVPAEGDRSSGGDVVGFDFFGSSLVKGSTTATLVIRTNALGFAADNMSISDGGVGVVTSYGASPTGGSTPEPASLGLMSIGALLLLRRRR